MTVGEMEPRLHGYPFDGCGLEAGKIKIAGGNFHGRSELSQNNQNGKDKNHTGRKA